jgi:DNA-binding GntR family transcriptional regulator
VTTASTKADDIALALEEQIVSGDLAPGQVLRQETLSEQFAVSRTPIREALRRLAALGLVSFEPNRGVRVRTLSRAELREAFLVRAELESLATEIATPKMTEDDVDELGLCEERFEELTERLNDVRDDEERRALTVEWVRGNHAFHDIIYRVADMPLIERLAKNARFSGSAVWAPQNAAEIRSLYVANEKQHRAIREAIAAGSSNGARALAREHVMASGRLLETILEQSQPARTLRRRTAR